jgi:hypothetical protein
VSSASPMPDFANAATAGNTTVIPRLAAAASSDSRGPFRLHGISRDDVLSWALLHLDKDGKDRTVGKPRLEAKRLEKVVDFRFIDVGNQIVRPIARALLMARRRAGHLIVIAMRLNEISCLRFVCVQSRVARERLRAGNPDQNILQARGVADDAICLAPWPVTTVCARYGSSAAAAIVAAQHVNAAMIKNLIMTAAAPGHLGCRRRLVICRASTSISRSRSRREGARWSSLVASVIENDGNF